MALIDEVKIKVEGGRGGNGCISFRREKYVPFGGPNGGNGGRGGNVYLVATRDKTSLLDFVYRPVYRAERGEHGMGKDMDGRGGEDMELKVPVGTLVYDAETGLLVEDLKSHSQILRIAAGGKGGIGNMYFATPTNRAPRHATPGMEGEIRELRLELRLLADVGLVGLPNAGKSSFLSTVSRARPKVADYPFTTLEPHLGVVDHKGFGFVAADLPGLIEGAAGGAGLGHQFLKHVTRNRILLHLMDGSVTAEEMFKGYEIILSELRSYDPSLLERPLINVFSKADVVSKEDRQTKEAALKENGVSGLWLSSHSHEGLESLLDQICARLQAIPAEETLMETPASETPQIESVALH